MRLDCRLSALEVKCSLNTLWIGDTMDPRSLAVENDLFQ
jgi:hypothetical protein